MIRKQLYIDARQDALLKKLADERGVPEARIVRECLDRYLGPLGRRQERALSKKHRPPMWWSARPLEARRKQRKGESWKRRGWSWTASLGRRS